MKKLQAKRKKLGNKGFSMIELIIVIAIMAILVGIIGSQLIPYLEKSRQKKDLSALDGVYTAFSSAITENEKTATIAKTKFDTFIAQTDNVAKTVEELTGYGSGTALVGKFKSKQFLGGTVYVHFDASSGLIEIILENTDFNDVIIDNTGRETKTGIKKSTP